MKFKILIFLFFIAVLFSACGSKDQKAVSKDFLSYDPEINQLVWNMKVKFIDSSYTKAILYADRGRVYPKKMQTIMEGNIRVEFLSKISNRLSLLTADSVVVDDNTRDMTAYGRVIIISDSTHTRLETSLLQWRNKDQKLYSTEFVKIKSPNESIQGYGFESDASIRNYKIFKVSGEQR